MLLPSAVMVVVAMEVGNVVFYAMQAAVGIPVEGEEAR